MSRGAGAPDVEITPAMIDAGVDAYSAADHGFDQPDSIVMAVFRAMMEARHTPTSAAALERQSIRQSRQWWT
jgi:hypothetical protein